MEMELLPWGKQISQHCSESAGKVEAMGRPASEVLLPFDGNNFFKSFEPTRHCVVVGNP